MDVRMNMSLRALALVIVLAVLGAFLLACARAVRKSRKLQKLYLEATPEDRARLDARALTEPELAEYMLPVPAWQIVLLFVLIAFLIWAKFNGDI
jgi:hypothetical protein